MLAAHSLSVLACTLRSRLSLSAMTARPVYIRRYQWVVVVMVWCFEGGIAVNKMTAQWEKVVLSKYAEKKSTEPG